MLHHLSELKDDSCHEMSADHIVDQTLCMLKCNHEKQLTIYCTFHFSLVGYKVLKLIVKNQHLFVKLNSSCSVAVCLLKGTLFLHLLWLLWLFHFLFLNLIFVEKKKRKLTAPFSFNTTSSIKDWWIAFHVAFVKSNLFCNLSSLKNNFNKWQQRLSVEKKGKKSKSQSHSKYTKHRKTVCGSTSTKQNLSFVD